MSSSRVTNIELELIKKITNGFSKDNKVGGGGFGEVYRGTLNGIEIAVKKLFPDPRHDDEALEAFVNEFSNLMSVKHKNIVELIGYSYEKKHKHVENQPGKYIFAEIIDRILCFEYMEKGSLAKHISAESCIHDLPTTYGIIKGICEGLHYLHKGRGEKNYIYHLDLKPDNILLDADLVPKIGDFGLSRLFGESATYQTNRNMKGTLGFMAPEAHDGLISPKNDVFSLGVLIFYIMAGRKGYNDYYDLRLSQGSTQKFIESVLEYWKNKTQATIGCTWDETSVVKVKKCIKIAMRCVETNRTERPTTGEILNDLKELDVQRLRRPIKSGLVGGNAGSPRDIEEKPWRLESLTISYLGLVDAFSFSYIDQAGKNQTAGPWGEGYSHDETKTILFGPYEFVEEVSGAYGSHFNDVLVMSLTFVTNIKTYGPFGNPYHQNVPSTPFRFRADEDSSITAFHGRSGRHRYSIGVYTCLSNKPTVTRPAPGQSLRPPIKSGLVGGSSGSPRDIEEKPWRLGSLTINYMGLVDAFSFSYIDQAGNTRSIGPWGKGYHHDTIETIRFGPSESLEEVSGAYGTHFDDVLVTSLTFVTNIRTYGPFGNPNHQNVASTPFRFRANKDSSIVGFHGRSDQHIHSIGVYTA